MASLASDGIPMAESSVEETRGINLAEGIDELENTRVSDIFDEGKDVNCERYLLESGENYSKPLEEHEQKNGLKDVDLKETYREEEDIKSNSLNVFDDVINSKDISNGETTDIHFENGEVSQHVGEKRDENEQEDSLDNEEALKMPQNEHRNEPDESDSRSMQDLVSENSCKEFISEDCCEDDHLHQSDKIEERSEIEDVKVIESMEGKGTVQVEDNAMGLPNQDYEIEPPAAVKHIEPEEIVDPKSLESKISEIQIAIKEYVFQSEPETKSSPMQTDAPSFETKSNEYDEEKIHVDTEASHEFSSTLGMASLASDGIPMAESSVEETRGINVAKGIDKLENTRVSDIFDEGKDVNCERSLMESGENYSKPLEEHEQKNGVKDVDLKETSREEEGIKSNSLNVFDDVINSKDIPNGETTDINFENGEVSQHVEEKRDENDQEDSLDNEEALKMPQNEHRNEPDESDSRSMQDLVPENSSKEFISEDCCEDDHLHQSDKIEERGKIEDLKAIESMEGKGTVQVEDNAMGLAIQDYEIEPPAVVKHLEPEEIVDPKSLESTVSETQNAIKEYVFQSEPETKSSPMQTDTSSFETKSNEYDEEKIHVDTEASLEFSSTLVSESSFLEPEEIVDNKSSEGTVSETQNAIEKDIFHHEPESKSSPMQTDTPRFETKSNEYDGEKIHVDTEASLEFSSLLESESCSLEPEEIVDQKSLESTASKSQNAVEEDIFHHEPQSKSLQMQPDTPSYEAKSNEYDGEKIHVDTEASLESSSMLESESFSVELEEIVDQKSLQITASETQNVVQEDIFHCEPETKSLVMQTDTSSVETKSNEFDAEKIHVDTDASLVFSSMLESESSSPFRYVEDSNSGTFLTHRGQESQDLQAIEGDNEALTLLREKALKIDATERASVWGCCGFWNWLHAHGD